MSKNAVVLGTGMYVPERVITNYDLEKIMNTSHDWIMQRTGISERRWADDTQGPSDLGVAASKNALSAAEVRNDEIDLILFATLSPDHSFPGSGVLLGHQLNMPGIPAMDIRCQCSGFIYAMSVAKSLIISGQYQKILIVGAEVHSPILNWTTEGRDMAVLFGDGAGAIVMGASQEPNRGIQSCHLHADGQFASKLWLERPGSKRQKWIDANDIEEGSIFPTMDGRYVFKHAVQNLVQVVNEAFASNNLQPDDIDTFIFHQANQRINEKVADLLGVEKNKIASNIEKYGNCSAASIPMLLDELVRDGRIHSGDTLCLAAFGSGFTWGSCIIRW